jgi:hypothetical protein
MIYDRLTEYCLHGGLYNPELMQHDKVRDLLIDCRDEIARLRLTDEERSAIEDAVGICEEHAEEYDGPDSSPIVATLRSLLTRLGTQRAAG